MNAGIPAWADRGGNGLLQEAAHLMGPTSAKARAADGVALAALAGGIAFSVAMDDWGWFARSGSAVVAIGILLTSSQIREHMKRLRSLRGQLMAQSQRDWASDEDKRALLRAAGVQESIWEGEGHGLFARLLGDL